MYSIDVAYDGVDDVTSKRIQNDFIITLFDRGLDKNVVTLQCLKNRTLSASTNEYKKAYEIADVMKTSVKQFGGNLI